MTNDKQRPTTNNDQRQTTTNDKQRPTTNNDQQQTTNNDKQQPTTNNNQRQTTTNDKHKQTQTPNMCESKLKNSKLFIRKKLKKHIVCFNISTSDNMKTRD